MEALQALKAEAVALRDQIPAECQTITTAQNHLKKVEEVRTRQNAVLRELERLSHGIHTDVAQVSSDLGLILQLSMSEINQRIAEIKRTVGEVMDQQLSKDGTLPPLIPAQEQTLLRSSDEPAARAFEPQAVRRSTSLDSVVRATEPQFERQSEAQSQTYTEAPEFRRQQTPSTSQNLDNPLFKLMPIKEVSEQISVQTELLNQIMGMFNQLAAGNFQGQKIMPINQDQIDPSITNAMPQNLDETEPVLGSTNEDEPMLGAKFNTESFRQTVVDALDKQNTEVEKISVNLAAIESKKEDEKKPPSDDSQKPTVELKLDKIQLTTFDGDLTNWIAFRDQYLDMVHNNPKLTKITKFYQLKSHLKGLALDAINGFKTSAADYDAAWFVLMKRYNQPDRIIDEYFRKFEALPPLTQATAIGIIRMVNAANQLVRVLPNLGVDVSSWDKWIIFNLKARLDSKTVRKWMDQVKRRQDVKLSELLEFLELEAAECLPTEAERSKPVVSRDAFKKRRPNPYKSATAMVVTTTARCAQCKKDHPLFRCPTFRALPTADRIKRVKAFKLCIRCLLSHQHPADCKFGACPTCSKDHNSLLCYKREQRDREREKPTENSDSSVVA